MNTATKPVEHIFPCPFNDADGNKCLACNGTGQHVAKIGSPATIIFMTEKYPATVVDVTRSTITVAWDIRRGHLSVPNAKGQKLKFVRRKDTWTTRGYTLYVGVREYKSTIAETR